MLDLKPLEKKLEGMLDITLHYMGGAFDAYASKEKIIEIDDDKVNEYESDIEEECLLLILKERPFAGDLRKITGIFKAVSDIERIGDHAEDVSWCVSKLRKEEGFRPHPLIEKIIEKSYKMVVDSFASLEREDANKANDVIIRDDEVDALYAEIVNDLANKKEVDGHDDGVSVYSLLLAKYAERVADHASNVAEWTIYIANGMYKERVIL